MKEALKLAEQWKRRADDAGRLSRAVLGDANNSGSESSSEIREHITDIRQLAEEMALTAEGVPGMNLTLSKARIASVCRAFLANTARYRWLADKVIAPDYGDNDSVPHRKGYLIDHCKGSDVIYGDSLDAAIDEMIELEKRSTPQKGEG